MSARKFESFGEMLDWVEAEQPWAKMPLALVMDFELTGADFRVYAVIDYRCGKSGQWYGSQSEISMLAGVTDRQVRTSIGKLETKGFLLTKRTGIKTSTVLRYAIPARATGTVLPLGLASDRNSSSADTGTVLPLPPEQAFRCSNTDHNTDHNTDLSLRESERKPKPKRALTEDAIRYIKLRHSEGIVDEVIAFWLNDQRYRWAHDKPAFIESKVIDQERRITNGNGHRPPAAASPYSFESLRGRANFVEG